MAAKKTASAGAKKAAATGGGKKLSSPKAAQLAARAGEIESAMAALKTFADGGDVSASCSLAELHAYRGEWNDVLARVAPLVADPNAIFEDNVKLDMVGLLWRAAEETKQWRDAAAILGKMPAVPFRDFVLVKTLSEYLASNGSGDKPRINADLDTEEVKRAKFEKWTLKAKETNDGRLSFVAGVEHAMFDEHSLRTLDAAKAKLNYQQVLHAVRLLVRNGRADEAWAIYEPRLKDWMPVAPSQVAPAELVYDPQIRPMMTAERCAKVLATPRG